jgi:hypothetical protein
MISKSILVLPRSIWDPRTRAAILSPSGHRRFSLTAICKQRKMDTGMMNSITAHALIMIARN